MVVVTGLVLGIEAFVVPVVLDRPTGEQVATPDVLADVDFAAAAGAADSIGTTLFVAVLADLVTKGCALAKGWILDIVETLRTNASAAEGLTTDTFAWKRNMVRAEILMAHPGRICQWRSPRRS